MSDYLGISENKLHHILGVARKAYRIAKDNGHDWEFCRKCFMLGWIHDVSYEFSEKAKEHPENSVELLSLICDNIDPKSYEAIKKHGKYVSEMTEEYQILNMADMLIDTKGQEVDVMVRLEDIKARYGEYSDQYLTACDNCYRLGLTAVNIAENITQKGDLLVFHRRSSF